MGLAALNCTDDAAYLADRKDNRRCPRCGLYHLRAGYCQALDSDSTWHTDRLGKAELVPDKSVVPLSESDVPLSPVPVPLTSSDVPLREIVPLSQCEICGADFEAKRSTARYCSDSCRVKAQRS